MVFNPSTKCLASTYYIHLTESSRLLSLAPLSSSWNKMLQAVITLPALRRRPCFPFALLCLWGLCLPCPLCFYFCSGHSSSHGLCLYFNHLPSSLSSALCPEGGAGRGRALGLWGWRAPRGSPDKVRTSRQQGLLVQRKPQVGHQPVFWSLQLAPRVLPQCLLQVGSSSLGVPAPPFSSPRRTHLSA